MISPKIWEEEQRQRTRRGRAEEANWDCAGFKKWKWRKRDKNKRKYYDKRDERKGIVDGF